MNDTLDMMLHLPWVIKDVIWHLYKLIICEVPGATKDAWEMLIEGIKEELK